MLLAKHEEAWPIMAKALGTLMSGPHTMDPDLHVDVTQDEDGYTLTAEMPGIRKSDLTIHVAGDLLTIKGERSDCGRDRQYQKALRLSGNVDRHTIAAKMEDGILTMAIPFKKLPEPLAIKIQ